MTPKILKDLEAVSQEPPFEETTYAHDAYSILAPYVAWEGSAKNFPETDKVRDLFSRFLYWKDFPGQLKLLMEDRVFRETDTSWMEELAKTDHWNLLSNPELDAKLRRASEVNGSQRVAIWSQMPVPTYGDLRHWATLNFLKLNKKGQGLMGLHAYHKAAQLIHSSGTLVGNMVAVAMLKDEQAIAASFKVSGWVPLPAEVIDAYQRVSWAWSALAREPWYGEFPEKFKPYMRPQLGMCAAAWEINAGISGFQDFLEPRFPFESDFSAGVTRMRGFQRELFKACNMGIYLSALDPSPPGSSSGLGESYSRVPYLRRVMGLIMMTVAVPDFLQIYERQAR